MQAVIMAGGKGSRLAAVTKDEIPKPMVPLAGKPLLLWQIEELKRNGIEDVTIVIGHLGNIIMQFFGDGSRYGIHITYIKERQPLGTAGAFYELKPLLSGQYFLLVFGDVYFAVDISRMEDYHLKHQSKATLFVHPNGHPQDSDIVVMDEGGRVVHILFKHEPRTDRLDDCVNAGLYILDRSVCECVKKGQKMALEKDILAPMAKKRDRIYGYYSSEYIKDLGTPERIHQAEAELALE